MSPADTQLALPLDAPPAPLDVRLKALGLRQVAAIRTHRNRSVLVSLTRQGVLRVHADFSGAPDHVLLAIVRFLRRGVPEAERRQALTVLRGWPVSSPERPRRARPAPASPEDARLLAKLANRWRELNVEHFGGSLGEIPIALSGRMRRRLGQLVYSHATGRPVEIVMKRRLVHRGPWADVEETLLHEMVHQWQAETGRKVDHGRDFRRKAREVGITPRAVADLTR
jgi:hypothetical protein